MTKWKDKNVGALLRRGSSKRKPVVDERDGTVGGYHTEKWDGSQDATVLAKTVVRKTTIQEGKDES